MKTKKIKSIEDIKGGYYGTVEQKQKIGNYDLYVAEIADPDDNETGWECASWSLVNADKTEAIDVANCDGYNGVEWQAEEAALLALLDGDDNALEALREAVTPYEITGALIAAAREAQTEDADDDYDGECKIWVTRYYLDGTCNAPTDGMLSDDEGDAIVYDDYAAAQEAIDELGGGTYVLSHGEYERPSYRIVKA